MRRLRAEHHYTTPTKSRNDAFHEFVVGKIEAHQFQKLQQTKNKKVKGQAAPTPERISEIQESLAKKGVLAGTPSGKWDDSTVDAVKQFQASNGLTPSGKLDALTLQKLGLGSETAGLAPPTPPPNSTNRLRNTSSEPVTSEPSN